MYIAIDMGTSNTRVWLCDKERVIGANKVAFGAKFGAAKGKAALYECLKDMLGDMLLTNSARALIYINGKGYVRYFA